VTVQGAGREDRPAQADNSRRDDRYTREEIRITEQDRYRPERKEKREEIRVYENDRYTGVGRSQERVEVDVNSYREPFQRYTEAQIDVKDRVYDRERPNRQTSDIRYDTRIDVAEREYRDRTTPFAQEYRSSNTWEDKSTRPREFDAAYTPEREPVRFDKKVEVIKTSTVEEPQGRRHRLDMGYHDEQGNYHSFRQGISHAADKVADRILHPFEHHHNHHHHHRHQETREEDVVVEEREITMSAPRSSSRYSAPSTTITIPCHHIRIGDLLILQGRPCQVIRITTSAQTGQHRYLGVDLFTKQLHEESSFASNPSPSVFVQNMVGPIFKQYRVLDITETGSVVAMTETGDVKQGLPVLDQSDLLNRLSESFNNGRGSIRVLVINDGGRELAVDFKVIHGSRL